LLDIPGCIGYIFQLLWMWPNNSFEQNYKI